MNFFLLVNHHFLLLMESDLPSVIIVDNCQHFNPMPAPEYAESTTHNIVYSSSIFSVPSLFNISGDFYQMKPIVDGKEQLVTKGQFLHNTKITT